MLIALAALYSAFTALFLFWNLRRRWLFNPSALFVLAQAVFFFGTLPLLDMGLPADQIHLAILCGTPVLFFAGNLLSQQIHPVSPRDAYYWRTMPIAVIEDGLFVNTIVYGIIAVSLVVCIFYYRRVGYNVFLMSAGAAIEGNPVLSNIANLRLNAYSGARYMAAGYVNQFKNTLLPLLTALLFARGILKGSKCEIVLALCLAPWCLVFLLGTGQRGALFLAVVTAFFFFTVTLPQRQRRRVNVILLLLFGLLFAVTTLILGRQVSSVHSVRSAERLGAAVIGRFTTDNQKGSVVGFRYVYGRDPKLLDGEYVHGLETLVPGHERRIPLASLIFQCMYGDVRGTAPASIWGTVWYDFNLPGVTILAVLLGYFYHYIYFVFIRSPKTLSRLAIFSGMYVILGLWVAGAPDTLLNEGLLTLLVLGGLLKLGRKIGQNDPGRSWVRGLALSHAGDYDMPLAPRR